MRQAFKPLVYFVSIHALCARNAVVVQGIDRESLTRISIGMGIKHNVLSPTRKRLDLMT